MNIEIINIPLQLTIYGYSGIAMNKDYTETAFKLMDKMWQTVKQQGLKNKGLNTWAYDEGDKVFAGVELLETPVADTGLEQKSITLLKYAYFQHTGPYNLIKQTGLAMQAELKKMHFETGFPFIEIYGHWTNDASKLETEILMNLKQA